MASVVSQEENANIVFDAVDQWIQELTPMQNRKPQEWSAPPAVKPVPAPLPISVPIPVPSDNIGYAINGAYPQPPYIGTMERGVVNNGNCSYGVAPHGSYYNPGTPGQNLQNGIVPVNGYINATPTNNVVIRAPGCVTNNKAGGVVKKQKRNRTAFTTEQLQALETEYTRTRYLDRNRRSEISEILNIEQRTIKIWFQNRRMKEKKDRAEALEDYGQVSTSGSSPDLTSDIPTFIQQPYPEYPVTVVSHELYSRGGMVMNHYPVKSTAMSPVVSVATPPATPPAESVKGSPIMAPIQNNMVSNSSPQFLDYAPEYIYESQPQSQCKQVNLEVQNFVQNVDGNLQEVPQGPTDNTPSPSTTVSDQDWDFSWIRSGNF